MYKRQISGRYDLSKRMAEKEKLEKERIDKKRRNFTGVMESGIPELLKARETQRVKSINLMSQEIYEMTVETALAKTYLDALVLDDEYVAENKIELKDKFISKFREFGGIEKVEALAESGVVYLQQVTEAAKACKKKFLADNRTCTKEDALSNSAFDFDARYRESHEGISKIMNKIDTETISKFVQDKVVNTIAYEKGEALATEEKINDINSGVDGEATTESVTRRVSITQPRKSLFQAISESRYKAELDESIMIAAESKALMESQTEDMSFMNDKLDSFYDEVTEEGLVGDVLRNSFLFSGAESLINKIKSMGDKKIKSEKDRKELLEDINSRIFSLKASLKLQEEVVKKQPKFSNTPGKKAAMSFTFGTATSIGHLLSSDQGRALMKMAMTGGKFALKNGKYIKASTSIGVGIGGPMLVMAGLIYADAKLSPVAIESSIKSLEVLKAKIKSAEIVAESAGNTEGIYFSDEEIEINAVDPKEVLAESIIEYTVLETLNTLNITKFKAYDVRRMINNYSK